MSSDRRSSLEDIRYEQLSGEEPPSRPESPRPRATLDSEDGWEYHEPAPSAFGTSRAPSGAGDVSPIDSAKRLSPRSTVRRQTLTSKSGARESRARKTTWTITYSTGVKTILHSDKRGIIQKFKLGVPIRDMRLLDPNLLTSETGKILVRDNAIVLSVEHVRLIITADAVIAPREGFERNPLCVAFNRLLEEAVAEFAQEAAARAEAQRAAHAAGADILRDVHSFQSDDDTSSEHQHEVAPLPFELQVLELALKDVCQLANQLTKDLDAVAHPALDALTKSVTTANLERVRKVKTRHQRLFTRVTTVREELQRFLEDDEDMAKMCLTRRKELEHAAGLGGPQARSAEMGSIGVPAGGRRHSLSVASATPRQATPFLAHTHQHQGSPPWHAMERTASEAQAAAAEEESESQEAVENLLESYFMQIDSTYDRLDAIGEFIEDTEEYINIELDSSRNRLLRLEIVLTAATFALALFSLVAGILGENLVLPKRITTDLAGFIYVNLGTLGVCFLFFGAILGYVRYRRLM